MKLEVFSHYQNILSNIDDLPIKSILGEDRNWYIAGGYALALIFAPREDSGFKKINHTYYDDIDVYFDNQQNYNEAINLVSQNQTFKEIKTTDDYFVFSLSSKNATYVFQFFKKPFSQNRHFFDSYDILNCCIAYSVKTREFYTKPYAIEVNVAKTIHVNENYNFNEIGSIKFSYRLNKYIARYKLKLSNALHDKLLYALIKKKDYLTTQEHKFVLAWSTQEEETIPKGFNIWHLFKYAFSTNPRNLKYLAKYYNPEAQ